MFLSSASIADIFGDHLRIIPVNTQLKLNIHVHKLDHYGREYVYRHFITAVQSMLGRLLDYVDQSVSHFDHIQIKYIEIVSE